MQMTKVTVYTKANCPYCKMAKDLLTSRKIDFEEIRIDLDENKFQEMLKRSPQRTVPQIFINDQSIGGYDDLATLVKSSKLDELLKN